MNISPETPKSSMIWPSQEKKRKSFGSIYSIHSSLNIQSPHDQAVGRAGPCHQIISPIYLNHNSGIYIYKTFIDHLNLAAKYTLLSIFLWMREMVISLRQDNHQILEFLMLKATLWIICLLASLAVWTLYESIYSYCLPHSFFINFDFDNLL